jgi:hypothetical protein
MCPRISFKIETELDPGRIINLPLDIDDPVRPAEWPDDAARERWCRTWAPPCVDGEPVGVASAIAQRERGLQGLELRVPLANDASGVCQVATDEREHRVDVRVFVPSAGRREWCDCPVRAWLDAPRAGRPVIDGDPGEPLPVRVRSG